MTIQAAQDSGSKVTVGAASTLVKAANTKRTALILTNDSDEIMYLALGADAVMNQGIRLTAAGGSTTISYFKGIVNAICTSGSKNLCVAEN